MAAKAFAMTCFFACLFFRRAMRGSQRGVFWRGQRSGAKIIRVDPGWDPALAHAESMIRKTEGCPSGEGLLFPRSDVEAGLHGFPLRNCGIQALVDLIRLNAYTGFTD